MANPYLGEIRAVGFNFAPVNWALCQGQILSIASNTALFSLLGTTYGGNGTSNFQLPDLQGRAAVSINSPFPNVGPDLGAVGGTESVTLLGSELAGHTHALNGSTATADSSDPTTGILAEPAFNVRANHLYLADGGTSHAYDKSVAPNGQGNPHENRQPTLVVNYIICTSGIFPPRG